MPISMFIADPITFLFFCIYVFFQEAILPYINIYNISYNLLYFVSLCQIKINKLVSKIQHYIYYIHNSDSIVIEYYKNDVLYHYLNINDYTKIDDIKNILLCDSSLDYIVIIKTSENMKNMFVCNASYLNNENFNLDLVESNVKFISLNVVYNENNYKVELRNNKYNFYIVHNKINNIFIRYYLKHILKTEIKDDFKYVIELLDNNVNFINLTNEESIIIEKDTYVIE
jgi:hypothetical protein